jgi:hypothetical protein
VAAVVEESVPSLGLLGEEVSVEALSRVLRSDEAGDEDDESVRRGVLSVVEDGALLLMA